MFQGASSLTLDGKGRLSVPARYRELLGHSPSLTLTKHPHGCLLVFPRAEWELFRDQVAALPMEAHWWKRVFLGNASEVDLDATGRVLITPELRAAAAITREVTLLGMGKHFELWDSARYREKEADEMLKPMPDVLQKLSF